MSEKQKKKWGVTVLVSEIKRVGNAVFLEVLVIEGEIGFLATSALGTKRLSECDWRTLDNAYLFISSQMGLFSTFLLVISFLQLKLASPKDN